MFFPLCIILQQSKMKILTAVFLTINRWPHVSKTIHEKMFPLVDFINYQWEHYQHSFWNKYRMEHGMLIYNFRSLSSELCPNTYSYRSKSCIKLDLWPMSYVLWPSSYDLHTNQQTHPPLILSWVGQVDSLGLRSSMSSPFLQGSLYCMANNMPGSHRQSVMRIMFLSFNSNLSAKWIAKSLQFYGVKY